MPEQLKHDSEQIQKKLDDQFELYKENEEPEKVEQLEKDLEEAVVANTHIQITRYLGHAQGRLRCFKMHAATREELFDAHKDHLEKQKEVYDDMANVFKVVKIL